MRFASYTIGGRPSYGIARDDGFIDLGGQLRDQYPTLRSAIAANALDELGALILTRDADVQIDEIDFLPVIPDSEKVICFGMNYAKRHPVDGDIAPPENPSYFLKPPGTLVVTNKRS